ncbi:MAG: exosortase/archaeosortase family protein [bacterium]
MDKKRLDSLRWLAVALLVVFGWFNYRYMIRFTMVMFAAPLEDMSHGWVVPFVSLYTLWAQRKALRAAAGLPSWRGGAWVCLFMIVAWFGGRGGQSRMEQASLIGLIWAVPYAFWGKGVARLMLFPASFLIFTIPVSSFLDFFTVHLRILASALATGILNGFGLSIERSGTALFSRVPGAEFNVDVADPCSGIRSLFAMMALTAAYAYFTQKTLLQKWALFACSIPLAMIGNIFRIFSICLVAAWFGQDVATGFYHDYSGYVVFLVGVLLMIQAGVLIEKGDPVLQRASFLPEWMRSVTQDEREDVGAGQRPTRAHTVLVCGVLCVMAGVFTGNRWLPAPTYDSADFVASVLPQTVGEFTSDVPWFCHNDQCLESVEERRLLEAGLRKAEVFVCPSCGGILHGVSLGEATDLPKDTVILKRNYHSPDGLTYAMSVVVGGRNRGSIHRAELCLPAQGFVMLKAGRLPLHLPAGRPRVIRKITAQRHGGATISLVYWFVSQDRESCSHSQRILIDVWDRSIHNRINRWVMVAVSSSSPLESPESVARFETFLSELYPQIIRDR